MYAVQVGGLALSGWLPLPWGQLGEGPKPASLAALVDVGIDMAMLDSLLDHMFNLDSCSPPMLLQGGSNRPMVNVLSNPNPDPLPDPIPDDPKPDPNQVEAAFASMLMYHSERKQAGEVRATPAGTVPCLPPLTLLTSPQPQVRPVLVALEKLVSHETLLSWETTIRTKFDADNAHLLMGRPTGDDAVRAVIRPLPLLYPQPCPHP